MLKRVVWFCVLICTGSFAGINMGGRIIDLQTQQGISGATVSITGTNLSTTTSSNGTFTISNIPVYSTGFQFKASKTNYVDTYTQLGNAGTQEYNDVEFPLLSNTLYNQLHTPAFGGISHTSGKADIMGMVSFSEGGPMSGVVVTARYMDTNNIAGTVRYVNTSNAPDSSLSATSDNGLFIVYNVDPYKPIKLIGTKSGSYFSSCVAICYPDKVTICGIEQIPGILQLSGKVSWNDAPISGATVSIPGTLTSTTTGADGSFTIGFNPVSYGVLKISKTNHVDIYVAARADEIEGKKQNNDEEEFFIIPQQDYTAILNSLGKTHISGKGDILGLVETINGMAVAGARISVYSKDNIKLNPDIFYFDEEDNPALGLNETTCSNGYLILNLDPGYYFVVAEKSGMEFSRNIVFVFSNGISSAPLITSWPPIPGIEKAKSFDIPSSNIGNNSQNVEMLAFEFYIMKWETDESVIFDSIIVTAKGTGNISTALSGAKLYLDSDNNGTYETQVSTGTISGNRIAFKNINKEVDMGLNQKYLVVFNFNGTASIGQTFGVDILKNADVYAHTKNTGISVTCEGDPIEGNLKTISQVYPPAKPENLHPQNNQTGINPAKNIFYLQSSNFNPGQGSNVHKATEWRIWKDGETYETFAWYSGVDQTNLTQVYPTISLESSTKYWWQVRYQNGDSIWSDWSDSTCFITTTGGIAPPNKPINQSPSNNETDVPLPVVLRGNQFAQGSSNVHVASQWQIYLPNKSVNPVFDTKRDVNNLTSITVSGLSYNTSYEWRVRYQDDNGAWSQWSDITNFTTKQGMKGDLNHDTQIDISDVILCLRMAIGLDSKNIDLADINNDQEVDISDVILILRKAIGLDP